MKLMIVRLVLGFLVLLGVSCSSVYDSILPPPPGPPAGRGMVGRPVAPPPTAGGALSSPAQREVRELQRSAREGRERAPLGSGSWSGGGEREGSRSVGSRSSSSASGSGRSGGSDVGAWSEPKPEPKPKPKPAKKDYRYAQRVPGKEGFVFNPYTNEQVDVQGVPSGTLVEDPSDPDREKHRFRVP